MRHEATQQIPTASRVRLCQTVKMKRFFTFLVIVWTFSQTAVIAASFNCAEAKRVIDNAICASPKVSALDSKMADAYNDALQRAGDKEAFRKEGRLWIQNVRDKCTDEKCLIEVYETRIAALIPAVGGNAATHPNSRDPALFYRGAVYGIGDGLRSNCEAYPNGIPVWIWGNREAVDIADVMSRTGRMLKVTGTYQNGTKATYWFFRKKEDCEAATRDEKVDQESGEAAAAPLVNDGSTPGRSGQLLASLSVAKSAYEVKDYARAFRLFKLLAEQGSSEAQAYLGLMYEYGQGVKADLFEAFRFYRSASEQGEAWAQTNLGIAYLNGRGTTKNETEAARWFRRAALQGKTKAQEALGQMYNQGKGVPKSHKEVIEFINPSNLKYISALEKDYKNRIHFQSKEAERIIRDFNIDCNAPQKNGHYLPLINLLYARLATADRSDMWIETAIQDYEGVIRIIDSVHTPTKILHTNAVFQINKWGELRPTGDIRTEAIRNACFDSHGPIWLLK